MGVFFGCAGWVVYYLRKQAPRTSSIKNVSNFRNFQYLGYVEKGDFK